MTLRQIGSFILRELSAGNFVQNIGFYTLLVLLIWIVVVQFNKISQKYQVNPDRTTSADGLESD